MIIKSEILGFDVECHGRERPMLIVRFAVEWSDGLRVIREWSTPMVGSVVVKEERVGEVRQ